MKKTGKEVPCDFCSKQIYKSFWQLKINKHNFCSSLCRQQYKKLNKDWIEKMTITHRKRGKIIKESHKKLLPSKNCSVCGTLFNKTVASSFKEWETSKYCSRRCYNMTLKGRKSRKLIGKDIKCKQCGKEFYAAPWEENNGKQFCTKHCLKGYNKKNGISNKQRRSRIFNERGQKCEKCGEFNDLVLHHKKYDYSEKDDAFIILCRKCHKDIHKKLLKEENKLIGSSTIQRAALEILKALKIDRNDANFTGTPERFARMLSSLCEGLNAGEEIKQILGTTFPSTNQEIILQKNIKTYSLCPHHLLLVEYNIAVGYIPKSKVLGLSKLTRLVELITKKPALQEDITDEITTSLMSYLDCIGAMCIIEGKHGCMLARGVKSEAITTTSSIKGVFATDNGKAKAEFMALLR